MTEATVRPRSWEARGRVLGRGDWLRTAVRALFRAGACWPALGGARDAALGVLLRAAPHLPGPRVDLVRLARAAAPEGPPGEAADALCRFVAAAIRPHEVRAWLPPETVVRAGVGDCKGQAALLCALVRARGARARVAVGAIGLASGAHEVHAWVVLEDGRIGDPTRAARIMAADAYAALVGGAVDLTPEYLRRRGGGARWRSLLAGA